MRSDRRRVRIATVARDRTPRVVPVGWSYNPTTDTIDVGGHDLANTKYRDVARHGAAILVDEVLPPSV
jgi:pyridoxamine 5'-phosphate oxidase family protein